MIVRTRALDHIGVVAARWDHLDVAREVARRIDAPLAILPGYSGAIEGTDDYFVFIDTLCRDLAALAHPGEGMTP